MATGDLITTARLQDNLATGYNTTAAANLITSIRKAIKRYCKRDFTSTAYDELYSGNGERRLILNQSPIISVESVRYRPVTVLKVINNATSVNQQARVVITSTGLTLLRVASGVKTTDTSITFAG